MLPIWGFVDYFAQSNSYEPSQHLTVTNEGSFFCSIFFSFFWYIIFRKPNQELLYQTTFWCGLVLNGLSWPLVEQTGLFPKDISTKCFTQANKSRHLQIKWTHIILIGADCGDALDCDAKSEGCSWNDAIILITDVNIFDIQLWVKGKQNYITSTFNDKIIFTKVLYLNRQVLLWKILKIYWL